MDHLTQISLYRYVLSIMVAVCLAFTLQSQSYYIDSSGVAEDLSESPNYLYIYDEEISSAIPIGFDFEFFGNTYTEFYFSDNGLITFDGIIGPDYYYAQYLPDETPPNNLIAATWEDLNPSYYGFMTYETIGSAPNRMCVIGIAGDPWDYYCYNNLQGEVHAQIVLYETSNIIEIHTFEWDVCYSATQGIENLDGTEAIVVPGRNDQYWYAYDDYKAFIPSGFGGGNENDAGIYGNVTTYCEGTEPVFTAVRNYGSENLDSVTINWEWDGVLQTPYYHNSYPIPPGETYGFNLGNKTFEFDSSYILKVWTSSPNGVPDEDPSNDTVTSTVKVGLGGTYTIGGVSPDYMDITAAFSALDSNGICDSVTFLIRDGTYNEQISTAYISGSHSAARVIFKSESEDSSAVTITYNATLFDNNYVIRHAGASYIEWHDVTIQNTGPVYARAIEIRDGCNDIKFKNCHFVGRDFSSQSNNYAVIYSNGNCPGTVIENSKIEYGSFGFFHSQSSVGALSTNIQLTNNEITDFHHKGVYLNNSRDLSISANRIQSEETNTYGIDLSGAEGNFVVSGNEILLLSNGYAGILANSCNDDAISGPAIFNNFISLAGTYTSRGLYIQYSDSLQLLFNNVLVNSTQLASRAAYLQNSSNCVVGNNVFVNTGQGMAIENNNSTSGFASDYNNMYSTTANLGRFQGDDAEDLGQWQELSGTDNVSLNIDPFFTDSADLHVANPLLNKAGTPYSLITTDIDDQGRHPSTPDIGADEFVPVQNDAGVISLVSPVDTCYENQDVVVAIKNFGSNEITTATINWLVNGVMQTPVALPSSLDTLGSGSDTAHVNLGAINLIADSTYQLSVWTSTPNGGADGFPSNDSLVTSYSLPLSGTYTVGGSDPDFNTIQDAIDALAIFGVCGPVTMAIRPGSYETQLVIPEISGASDTSRITFTSETGDSSSVSIYYGQQDKDLVEIRGADYLTFKKLTFDAQAIFDMRVFVLKFGVHHLRFENNYLSGTPNGGTGSEIIFSSSTHADTGIVIQNNHFVNGYSAISLFGTNDATRTHDILVDSNQFTQAVHLLHLDQRCDLHLRTARTKFTDMGRHSRIPRCYLMTLSADWILMITSSSSNSMGRACDCSQST